MALLIATFAYIITIIVGIISQLSLVKILTNGIITIVLFALFTWITIYIIETIGENKKTVNNESVTDESTDKKQNINTEINSQTSAGSDKSKDDFTPLNPTVLEVDEEEGDN